MSVSASSLVERIRDVTDQAAGPRAGDQVARRDVGREVLQALNEIDRIALQGSGAVNGGTVSRVLCAADGSTALLKGSLSSLSVGARVAASNTGLISGVAARNAASVVCAAVGGVSIKR